MGNSMLKKILIVISVLFFVATILISLLIVKNNKKNQNIKSAEEIISAICKNEYNIAEKFLGPIYYKNIEDDEKLSIEKIGESLNDILDYSFDGKVKKNNKEYITYKIILSNQTLGVKLIYSKQPKEWLIEEVELLKEKKEADIEITSEILNFEISEKIVAAVANKDYKTVYSHCDESFGAIIGYKFPDYESLEYFVLSEFDFMKSKYKTFEIIESKVIPLSYLRVEVAINPGESGEFTLILLYSLINKDKLIGMFIKEINDIKSEGFIFDIYTKSVDGKSKEINEKGSINYSMFLQSAYANNNNKLIYAAMTKEFRNRLTYNEFETYLELMQKRVIVMPNGEEMFPISEFINVYDKTFYRVNTSSYKDLEYKKIKNRIPEKDFVNIVNTIDILLDVQNDVILGDTSEDIQSKVSNIFFRRTCSYIRNDEELGSDVDLFELHTVENKGKSKDLTEDENTFERSYKASELIIALKFKDYEKLWEIESINTGFDNVDEMVKLIELQEKIVGTFEGIYLPIRKNLLLSSGIIEMEYAYETPEGLLNSIIITFDYDNEILDFNVSQLEKEKYVRSKDEI